MSNILDKMKQRVGQGTLRLDRLLQVFIIAISVLTIPLSGVDQAFAAVQNPAPAAQISFTFDDGLQSAATNVQPTLAKYGLTATDYVITGCVGKTTVPNTCHADTGARYMTWAQIKQLQSAGWEIGSHTVSHPYLASSDASDGQPFKLTQQQVIQELTNSKSALAAQGITATAFASPYGDYNTSTLAQIAKLYTSHRGFADHNQNLWPYNDYLLNDYPVQAGVTVAQVEARIDQAITNKEWLILTMHDILPNPSTNPDDYQYAVANLDQIAAYVKAKQDAGLIRSVNISSGIVSSDANLMTNSTFDSGIAGGWHTDSTTITKDVLGNGSFPSPANSMKLVSQATAKHLFSPLISVDPSTTYVLKNFLNVTKITSGEVGFYIDEYDANSNWISGQYKNGERSAFVEDFNFAYKPTSVSVKKASLQVIVSANSAATAYLDNSLWFAASTTPVTTSPNLLTNSTFDNGIADGWTTDDPVNITKDTTSHGSPANPVNSILLKSSTKNTHLFSPKVAVDSTKSYTLTNYVNLQSLTSGEVGFYVDEYDSSGNWVSGKYVTGVRGVSAGDVAFSYKPTSANVKSASLQVIVTGNSGITAYFDDARWVVVQ